jgi:hypothetical protein
MPAHDVGDLDAAESLFRHAIADEDANVTRGPYRIAGKRRWGRAGRPGPTVVGHTL